MTNRDWKRITVAAAAVGLLAACDQPTEVGEEFSTAMVITAPITANDGAVTVCKEGPAGTYNFDVTAFDAGEVLNAAEVAGDGTFSVDADECVEIATATTAPLNITVDEVGGVANTQFLRADIYNVAPGATQTGGSPASQVFSEPVTVQFGDAGKVIVFVNQLISTDPGCTLTQGYWKTHADPDNTKKYDDTWDDLGGSDAIFLWGLSYIDILNTAPKGDAWYILAHQYIAAILNEAAGANTVTPTDITDELADALALLTAWAPGTLGPKATGAAADARDDAIELAGDLDDWNNGVTGPGHCDEDTPPLDN